MASSGDDATGAVQDVRVYGDYEIINAIGKGKFAVVYRAKRISNGEIVALKRISVDTIDDKAREKCLKEVRFLQSLDHPNVIKYYDSFINENDLVIVFEWAAAGDLKRQLRKTLEKQSVFDERIIWKYFSQIADAIAHMHDRRIMHRDLKPANIFLTLDGTVKVGDLGLSRELSEHTLQAHSKVGTPLYMSPEVIRGDGYDFKSDIWSLGCLLYELAMLKSPFRQEGLNFYSLFQKISKGDYAKLPNTYSSELQELCYAMLMTDPVQRPEISDICLRAANMRRMTTERYLKQKREREQKEDTNSASGSVNSGSTKPPVSKSERRAARGSEFSEASEKDSEDERRKYRTPSPAAGDETDADETPRVQNRKSMQSKQQQIKQYFPSTVSPSGTENTHRNLLNGSTTKQNITPERTDASPSYRAKPNATATPDNYHSTPVKVVPPDALTAATPEPKAKSSLLQTSPPAFSFMEIFHSKWIVLQHISVLKQSRSLDILPWQFAVDRALLGKTPTMQHSQYRLFVDCAMQLLCRCRGESSMNNSVDVERDPPMTIAKVILKQAQDAGISASELSSITPTSIVNGFGENVCRLLNLLADKALVVAGHHWASLVYPSSNNDAVIEGVEEEEEIEDLSVTYAIATEEEAEPRDEMSTLHHSIIQPSVSKSQWLEETERVAAALQSKHTASDNYNTHLMKISHLAQRIRRVNDDFSVAEHLHATQVHIREQISQMQYGEKTINKSMTEHSQEYSKYQSGTTALEERLGEINKRILAFTDELAMLEDKLSEVNTKFESKTSDADGSKGITDMKRGIAVIKEDNTTMTIRTALLQAEILNLKRLEAARQANAAREKKRSRNTKSRSYGV